MKERLKSVILDQQEDLWDDSFIKRQIPDHYYDTEEVIVISGIRRCGKSTLLNQIRIELQEKDYYLNFDDERLIGFKVEHFQDLFETFVELFGQQKTFYFDEIQNVWGWERFIRRLRDQGNKVFITGSNASMLSRELGTHLTGRYMSMELFPFSFREYLQFNRVPHGAKEIHLTRQRSALQKHFQHYLHTGGIPLYIKNRNDEYLKSLYNSIIYRDVLVRNRLTSEKEMLELVHFLASNVAKSSSNNSLAKVVQVKNASTIRKYLDFLQNTYLLFQVNKYDVSLKKQLQNQKKTYFIDNGLVEKLAFMFSDNLGRLLENLVYVELLRRKKKVYYHKQKYECDFVIQDGKHIKEAIQVCYAWESEETKSREIRGLKEAMSVYKLDEALILTNSHEEEINVDGKKIRFMPVWRWLLV
ncbi:MAG: ATP-binding protein [Bacteroidota bacterium]|nr:ATP-binding protein [Bacteroidota bacterium]